MMKPLPLHVYLILSLAFVSAIHGRSRPELTRTEALEQLMEYQGSVQGLHATFPQAITSIPPLTSMGPTSVSENCYDGWRSAMNQLKQEGYRTSFRDVDDQIVLASTDLTAKGKAFFSHLTTGSIYCTARLIPQLGAADLQIGELMSSADGRHVQARFRAKLSKPFRIIRANGLFKDGCGAELNPAVVIEGNYVAGHAHFDSTKAGWRLEKFFLGEHGPNE